MNQGALLLLLRLDHQVAAFDKKLNAVFKVNPACQRIARIKGVGPTPRLSLLSLSRRSAAARSLVWTVLTRIRA
jgi:hypothetical protein